MRRIADGFALAEAPVVTNDDVLLVSDVLDGGVRRFDADGSELPALIDRRRGIGGMAQLASGEVLLSGRDLSVVHDDGTSTVLCDLLEGGTGFNDLAVDADGHVIAGMLTCHPMSEGALTAGVVVQVAADGTVRSASLPFGWPNGIGFSPCQDQLYLADFHTGVVHRSVWTGSVDDLALEPWVTSPSGDADGLVVTSGGDVLVAAGAGGSVLRYSPAGQLLETLDVPDDFVSSCCLWPGRDRLVVTTGTGVFLHDGP